MAIDTIEQFGAALRPATATSRRGGVAFAVVAAALLLAVPSVVQSQISRAFTQRFPTTNTTGSITLIGNTLSTCNAAVANCLNARAGIGGTLNNDAFTSTDVDVDADGTTFNSSSATLTLVAGDSVMFAGLYWGAHSADAARNTVLFQTPTAAYATITATQLDADVTQPARYQGFRDVTTEVRAGGSGNYLVANVQRELAANRYAGWALVVVLFNSSSLPRSLVVFDGYARVFTGVPVTIDVSGLNTPPAGAVNTQLGIIGYEGDLGIVGDVLQLNATTLSDAQNPANNAFNSSISRLGTRFTAKNPDYVNQLSFDADILDASNILPNGATTATINLSSTGDQYYPGVVIFANELYSPTISGSGSFDKSVVDVNGGSVMAGDTLEYTLNLVNTGLDTALSIVVVDTIPANASYAAGSLSFVTSVAGGPAVGAKTDGPGDDAAEFSAASNRVVFRIGIGATSAAGGKLGPAQSSSIRFRVVISPSAPLGAVVSNQGYATYVGQSLGTTLTGVSDDPGSGGQQATAVTVTAPDLSVAKSHAGNFTAGVAASYTLTVTNAGTAPTFGTLTLIDSVPAGLTPTGASGSGWGCGIVGQVVTCTNPGPLAVAAVSTVTVNVSVQAGAVPAVTNIARVATTGDGNAANDRATDPTTVGAGADLAVIKTDGVTAVNPGATLTYTIVASNAGPSAVTAATLTDTFDPAVFNVAGVSWTCAASAGSSCPASGSGNLNAAVNLLSAGTATFTVSAPVLLSATGTITNTATVTVPGGTTELVPGNNSATDNDTQITPGADLAMTKVDAPDPVNAGAALTYTLTGTNNGPLGAQDVTIADATPAATTFLSATPSAGGSCSTPAVGGTGVVSCVWTGSTASAAARSVTLVVTVSSGTASGTIITNTATASSSTFDPVAGNNAASATSTVAVSADVGITKVGPASVVPGTNLVYTLTVTNGGPSDAAGVSVADVTPAGLTFVSNAGDCVAAFPCALGAMTAGAVRTITTTYAVPASYSGANPIVNAATVSSPTADPVAANNTGTASTPVAAGSADLSLTKTGPASVTPGQTIAFTITVTNNGPSDAAGVAVDDPTPAGLTFQSNAGDCVTAFPCALGTVAAAAARTITATYLVPSGYGGANPILNTAAVTAVTSDPNAANNAQTASVTVNAASADLAITKTGPASVTPGQTLVYTITVTNNGPSDAAGVSVSDPSPAGLAFLSNAGDCTSAFPCSLGALPAGAVRTITTTFQVPSGYAGANPIVNTATVSSPTGDPVAGNNSAAASTPVNAPSADVEITKVGPASVVPGTNLVYTLTVTNNGPSDAASVAVADVTPAGLTFVSNAGDCVTAFPCALGTVAAGAVRTITTTFAVPAGYSGANPIVNAATVTSPTADPAAGNNTGTASTPVAAGQADLSLTKTGPASVTPGQTVAFTIVVTNNGPSNAAGVSVADVPPAGLTFVSTTGDCTTAFPCALGTLAAAAVRTITATYAVPSSYSGANPILNTAAVTTVTSDPNAANDAQTASVAVNAASADLAITKVGPGSVTPGQSVVYTITVTNNGPSDAASVSVADAAPAGLTFVSNAGSCATAFPCALGSVPAGAVRTITTTFQVPSGYAGANPIVNTATVSSPTGDPVAGNNSATASTPVNPASADLGISKAGPASVVPGTNLVYTLTVTNIGPSDGSGVSVADVTPAGLTFVANTGDCATAFPCALGTVPAGAVRTITTTFAVPSGYSGANPIVNSASVTAATGDPVAANNTGNASTPVAAGLADLSLTKTGPASVTPGQTVAFTIVVANAGASDAAGVSVGDATPAGLAFVSNAGACLTAFPCNLGTVPAGATRTITATYLVPSGYSGANPILNTASVTTVTSDPNPGNEAQTASVTVNAASADLAITKTGPASVTPGQTLVHTITVTNNGPSDAASVSVADATPAGLTFVSNAGACTSAFPCGLGTVPAGAVRTITTTFQVPSGYAGANPIVNTATVSSPTGDPAAGNNSGTAATPVNAPSADVGITKTGPASVVPGMNVVYTLTVTNNGPSDATNVSVADATPAGLTFLSNAGDCVTAFPCGLGTIAAGAARTITATFAVPSGYSGANPVVNTATVSSPTADPAAANNSATATTAVASGSADLSLTKSGPAAVTAGQTLVFTIAVTNNGPSDAAGVSVADATPAGLTFVSTTGACTSAFPCNLGTVPAGAVRTITATYVVPSGYSGANPILNTSSVTAVTSDPNPGNEAQTVAVAVSAAAADLSLTKTGPAAVTPGQTVIYAITVTNNGPSDAASVAVADATPAGLSFISNAGACVSAFPCSLGTVPAGAVRTITTTFLVPSGYAGPNPIVNTATVSSPTGDPVAGNESGTASTPVNAPSADLAITKTGPAGVAPGTNLVYTLVLTNTGPSDAQGVSIADPTPPGLTFVSAAAPCAAGFPCALGTLTAGAGVSVTVTYAVPSAYAGANPILNTASVTATTVDPVAGNNAATASTPVVAGTADLAAGMTGPASVVPGTNLVFTITATNNGPGDAVGVSLADPTPTGLTFVSNAGDCTTAFPCALGTVPSGVTRTITARFLVPSGYTAPDPIVNTVSITSTTTDLDPSDDAVTVSVPLAAGSADLSVAKTGPASVVPGQTVAYTLTIANAGPSDATGVSVADPTPSGLTFVSNAGDCTGAFPCSLGTLVAGATRTITTTLSVPAGYSGPNPIVNTATISSPTADPASGNNTGTATTPVAGAIADLGITKAGPASVVPGTNVAYTLVVTNAGPSDAPGVTVADATPAGLTFISTTGACVTAFPCALGTVPLGATRTITATFRVPSGYATPDPIVNTAAVSSGASDPVAANDVATASTPLAPASADVAVTKTGPAGVVVGTNLVYTVAVTNAGPSDAANVSLDDPTPPGLTFVSATAPCAAGFPCTLGTVAAGATVNLTVTYLVPVAYAGPDPIVNTATASSSTADPNGANNASSTATPLVAASADVAVTNVGPANVVPGTNASYTITVTNNGPNDAVGVSLAIPTPVGAAFVSASAPCAGGFPCALGMLASGANVVLTVTYALPPAYTVPNPVVTTATVSASTADPNAADNTSVASATVTPTADLGVTMSDGVTSATPGTVLNYAIVVTNAGPSTVVGAAVSDPAPTQLLGVTWTCTPVTVGASCAAAGGSGGLTTTVDLPSGGIVNLAFSGTVAPVSGSITNTVTIAAPPGVTDPAGADNSATDVTTIDAVDLQLTKTHSGAFTLGTTGVYTLTVTNVGNVATTDSLLLVDSLPAGLGFDAASGVGWACAPAGQVVTCVSPGPLAPNSASSVALTVAVQPGIASLVTNVARVTTTGDVSAGNDRATDPTAITSVNLALAKRHTGSFVVGQAGLYTLMVRNVGTAPTFGGITLTDTLPNGLTFISGTGPAWACLAAGQVVTCDTPGPLAAGDSSAVALAVTVGLAALPQVTNSATVATPGDTTAGDDAATDVPTVVVGTANLAAEKGASRGEVEIGDQIEYTVRVRNNDVAPAPDVTVTDRLPVGFAYVPGSARRDGAPAADPAGGVGPQLVFTVDTLAGGATATLTYKVRVGPGAALGDGINRAQASTSLGPSTSNMAAVRVRLVGGVFTDEGIIVGKVFLDCDCNAARVQDHEELGVPGVRIYLEDGTSTVTDVEGKYSFYGVSPRLHIVKLDGTTLPAGATLRLISNRQAGDAGSRFVDVQRGELHRADFAAQRTPETLAAVKERRDAGELVLGGAIPSAGAGRDTLPVPPDSLGDVYRGVLPARTLTQDNSNIPPLPDAELLPSLAIGRRGAIALAAPLGGIPADGNTLVPVQLRLLDATGAPLTDRTMVTLEASAGRWQVDDDDPVAPGIQTAVVDGARTLLLVAAAQAGQAQLRVSANGLSGSAMLAFVPARRPLLAAGVFDARIDLRSRSLPSAWARDRFEAELRALALKSAGERLYAGTRAAMFVQGMLGDDLGVTFRLDTERGRDGRLFRDIRPEEFYPVYGDASIKDFAAQSMSRLYLRLERARSFFLFGDYATTPPTEVRMLGAYSRSLNGALQHVENRRLVANVFASRGREFQVVDEFAAQGTSGPFVLSQRSGLANSERVEILTRDRNQPAVILKTDLLARFADYTIEPFTGRLLLRAPVPSVDQNLNPNSVRVTYEVEQGGTAFWTFGADAQVKATDRVELGGSAVRDDNPLGARSILSANSTIRFGLRTYVIGEFAHADSAGASSGEAARFELRHFADRWEVRLSGLYVATDFANPSSALGRGRGELAVRGSAILDRRTRLLAEAVHSDDLATGFVRSGAQLGVERQITDRLRLELGLRHAEDTAATNSVRLRLTGQVAPRASVFGELEQDLAAVDQRRALLGGDYRFADRARLYARHELISSFTGPYALNGAERRNTTVIGLDADYLKDASVFSEYRARDAFNGREAEAAIGLRNRWTLAPGLRLNTSFERVSPLAGAGGGEATAITGAVEYLDSPRWRGSARLEYRNAPAGDGWLATLGYGRKVSRDWTVLGRSVYSALAGGDVHERSQVGLAFRQTDVNRWSALARYEHKYDRTTVAGGPGSSDEAHILSSHVNFQPAREWTFSGELAAKFAATHAELLALRAVRDINAQWDVGASIRTLATLGQGRSQYGLGLEIGRTVRTNLRVAAGYNFFGFQDRDLVGQNYTDHGVYLSFGFKFDEDLLGLRGRP